VSEIFSLPAKGRPAHIPKGDDGPRTILNTSEDGAISFETDALADGGVVEGSIGPGKSATFYNGVWIHSETGVGQVLVL
jgi:hypothetical protein